MSAEKTAIRYAQSIFDLASESKKLDAIKGDMEMIQASIKGSAELSTLLKSPIINSEKKQTLLASIFGGKIAPETMNFLKLLTVKRRENITDEVVASFIDLYNVQHSIIPVKLRTAVAVSEDAKKAIIAKIPGNVQLETTIDPSLIGGFVVEYDHKMMDASVARSISVMKQKFS
jgi:F-type H+-transporting ATPase subunit delta